MQASCTISLAWMQLLYGCDSHNTIDVGNACLRMPRVECIQVTEPAHKREVVISNCLRVRRAATIICGVGDFVSALILSSLVRFCGSVEAVSV